MSAALPDEDVHATTHVEGGAASARPDPGPVPSRSRVTAAHNGTNGTVQWRVATQRYKQFGTLSTSAVSLKPGESKTITVSARTPATPGDISASIVFSTGFAANTSTIPVTLRSEVDVAGQARRAGASAWMPRPFRSSRPLRPGGTAPGRAAGGGGW